MFFLASPWFQHLFKITYNLPHAEKGRCTSRHDLPCKHNVLQPTLRLLASLMWLRLGRGLEWACKVMYSCIPPPKWQNAKPNAGHSQSSCPGSLSYLQAVPELSLKRGGGVKIHCPFNGVFGVWTVFLEAAVRPERGLLRFYNSEISAQKGCIR